MCLQGGEVSRRNGSGGRGSRSRSQRRFVVVVPILDLSKQGSGLRRSGRMCFGRQPRRFCPAPLEDRTPQRRALREAEVTVPITSSGSKLQTFALVSRPLGYLSIAEEPCLAKQHPMSDDAELVTSSVRPGVTRHTQGRAKTARTITQILGPYRSQQVSVFTITAYLPWFIRKSGA